MLLKLFSSFVTMKGTNFKNQKFQWRYKLIKDVYSGQIYFLSKKFRFLNLLQQWKWSFSSKEAARVCTYKIGLWANWLWLWSSINQFRWPWFCGYRKNSDSRYEFLRFVPSLLFIQIWKLPNASLLQGIFNSLGLNEIDISRQMLVSFTKMLSYKYNCSTAAPETYDKRLPTQYSNKNQSSITNSSCILNTR